MPTKRCCYIQCKSDSRYQHKDYMKGVFFIPFPKLFTNPEKCLRWVQLCAKPSLTVETVKQWTYICCKHFVGGNGPTEEHPDPIQGTQFQKPEIRQLFNQQWVKDHRHAQQPLSVNKPIVRPSGDPNLTAPNPPVNVDTSTRELSGSVVKPILITPLGHSTGILKSNEKPAAKLTIKRCAYAGCTSDTSRPERCKGVKFFPFPNAVKEYYKCLRWIKACGRDPQFSVDNVKPWTYICNKHFSDPSGPTEKYPNPIPKGGYGTTFTVASDTASHTVSIKQEDLLALPCEELPGTVIPKEENTEVASELEMTCDALPLENTVFGTQQKHTRPVKPKRKKTGVDPLHSVTTETPPKPSTDIVSLPRLKVETGKCAICRQVPTSHKCIYMDSETERNLKLKDLIFKYGGVLVETGFICNGCVHKIQAIQKELTDFTVLCGNLHKYTSNLHLWGPVLADVQFEQPSTVKSETETQDSSDLPFKLKTKVKGKTRYEILPMKLHMETPYNELEAQETARKENASNNEEIRKGFETKIESDASDFESMININPGGESMGFDSDVQIKVEDDVSFIKAEFNPDMDSVGVSDDILKLEPDNMSKDSDTVSYGSDFGMDLGQLNAENVLGDVKLEPLD